MYKCDICGREVFKKIRMYGHTLCSKHMHQFHKYGHVLDTNPRTVNDLNDYAIMPDGVYFNLYNQRCDWIGFFVVDLCDIELVKYHKWRLSHGHVVTGNGQNVKTLSDIILGTTKDQDLRVEYINSDPLDNRRKNLKVIAKSSDQKIRSSFIGISYDKSRATYNPEININEKRIHLGRYKSLDEAIYVRRVAEQYVSTKSTENIIISSGLPFDRQEELKKYTVTKIQAHFGN